MVCWSSGRLEALPEAAKLTSVLSFLERLGALAAAVGLLLGGVTATAAGAEEGFSGQVFVDTDGDGLRGPGEPPLPGIAVTNGLEVVRTDADGRYALPHRDAGFVALTRPAGFAAPRWYAKGSADFGLRPVPGPADAFFVQVSDSHVYDRIEDFERYSMPGFPSWIPGFARDWLTLLYLDDFYAKTAPDGIAAGMRQALKDVARSEGASPEALEAIDERGDVATLRAYTAELRRPGSPLSDVGATARRAFEEIAALQPSFVVNTGDLILEGNAGSAEAVARWLAFYREITSDLGVPVYDTIGNNEIAGNQNPGFPLDDPGYGKGSFERVFGPTHYSFDRGDLHFVALDTHRPTPEDDRPRRWSFVEMEPDVRRWLENDLAAHAGRVAVVLNHEPFHLDPAWPLERYEPADDEGVFDRFDVRWVLSGHTHWNSFVREGERTHVTTGALSGMRWILPPDVHPRGYRLFLARERALHSAWKPLGEPVVAWAEGPEVAGGRVVVAADAAAPFARVRFSQGGTPLEATAWHPSFFWVPVRADAGALVVEAESQDGRRTRSALEIGP